MEWWHGLNDHHLGLIMHTLVFHNHPMVFLHLAQFTVVYTVHNVEYFTPHWTLTLFKSLAQIDSISFIVRLNSFTIQSMKYDKLSYPLNGALKLITMVKMGVQFLFFNEPYRFLISAALKFRFWFINSPPLLTWDVSGSSVSYCDWKRLRAWVMI